jgi:hypothetical protein
MCAGFAYTRSNSAAQTAVCLRRLRVGVGHGIPFGLTAQALQRGLRVTSGTAK